jgi:hypothetical protein
MPVALRQEQVAAGCDVAPTVDQINGSSVRKIGVTDDIMRSMKRVFRRLEKLKHQFSG